MLSVPKSRALWFVFLFILQSLGCMGIVTYQEIVGNTTDTALETAIAVGKGFEPFVIIIIATSVITVEGVAMLYDLYKREVERQTEERTARRTWEEAERLTQEWEKLSPREQKRQGVTEYVRSKRSVSDEEK